MHLPCFIFTYQLSIKLFEYLTFVKSERMKLCADTEKSKEISNFQYYDTSHIITFQFASGGFNENKLFLKEDHRIY